MISSFRLLTFTTTTLLLGGAVHAQLESPEWIATTPIGAALGAGTAGFVVDAAGNSYATGTGGSSSNTDVVTVSFDPDGALRWRDDYNGPVNWHDQGRGITLGPDGLVWVTGNTPAASKHANVLVLGYDATSGTLLHEFQYTTGPGIAEHGASIVVDAAGNIYVGGGTVGDGSDALILSFEPSGNLRWRRQWDGAAWGPYSQDHARELLLDPDGNLDVLLSGVAADLQPDYYVNEYDVATGATLFEASWGTRAGEYERDMEIDAAGDIFVTGTGLDFTDKYSTVKFDGTTGGILWQRYDFDEIDDHATAIALDAAGDAYVTGTVDPDGDESNFNDDMYTVKRDGQTGDLLWTHRYGETCKRCFDVPSDLIVDSAGNLFLAGSTSSPPYPGVLITFVLDAATGIESQRGTIAGGAGSGILRLDAAENLYNGGGTYNATTGAKQISVFKYASLVSAPSYSLEVLNLLAGELSLFTITKAKTGQTQYVAFGVNGPGSLSVPQLGVTLDVASPKLLFKGLPGEGGSLQRSLLVPPGISGLDIWFQAVEQGATTPLIGTTVQ